ncbi:hypothetical protein [Pseudomonas oryzihabitans]|uniref:hypothetical protein n=1 Tax=Pseudomonas oryzihabitans TaxID=47885 RepID=UPI002B1D72A5|nr:hypothetical protein [Pseudomonas oryzihabitans]
MKNLKWMSVAALMGVCISANAEWRTFVEDDVISDAKTAMLVGAVDGMHRLVFDCDSSSLTMSLLEDGKWREGMRSVGGKLVVKVDKAEKNTFSVALHPRNEKAIAMRTEEAEKIKKLLGQIRESKSKVLLGFVIESADIKWTGEADTYGSTKAVDQFTKACGI